MSYRVREIYNTEYDSLEDFLYEAIFIPEGISPPSRDIIMEPELRVYLDDFSKKVGDITFVAEDDKKNIGAVWVRIMSDYGHIDDAPPFACDDVGWFSLCLKKISEIDVR